jgi:DNA-binding response OmpR family regulator
MSVNAVTERRAREQPSPRSSTVLVVDDEPESLELLRVLLVSQGYKVQTAPGSEAAMAVIERGGVDLIVCDLMMSRMDGVELCAHVRGVYGLDLPIVFVTSLHDRASRIRAKEAGADDFLVKPVDGLELLVRVESLLRARTRSETAQREKNQLMVALASACAQLGGEPVAGAAVDACALSEVASQRAELEALAADLAAGTAPAGLVGRLESMASRAQELELRLRRVLEDGERAVRDVARGRRDVERT